jgi:4-hydroxybenzoate polyprenyltransferase
MKPQYTEDDMVRVIADIANGKSERTAAKEWGIPRTSLRSRIQGSEEHSIAAESQQRLSRSQENHLSDWILTQEALSVPLTHGQVKEFAQRLLIRKGDNKPLGKRWIQAFLRRNPVLKTKRARNIDSQRVNGATIPIIQSWFQLLSLPQIQAIKPENRWNMDESGIMEGQGVNGLVIGSAEKRSIQKKQPGSRA